MSSTKALPRVTQGGLLAGLVAWTGAWFGAMVIGGGMSWHFFVEGQQSLFGPGATQGFHVYATHPLLQIGPVAFVIAGLIGDTGPAHGLLAAQILCASLGLVVVILVGLVAGTVTTPWRGRLDATHLDTRLLLAAYAFVPVWMYLAVASLHLDDALALTLGVAAILLARRGHAIACGAAIALAIDSKPWAVPFVVVVLVLPSARLRLFAVATTALGVAVAWAPFFLVDPETVRALHFTIVNTRISALRVLGVLDPRTPSWDRPAQTAVGILLATWVVRQRRWPALLLVVMTVRVVLDPGTNRYYLAGLAVGALLWDVCGSSVRVPIWSLAVLFIHSLRWFHELDSLHGWLVLVFALCVLGFVVVPTRLIPPPGTGSRGAPIPHRLSIGRPE